MQNDTGTFFWPTLKKTLEEVVGKFAVSAAGIHHDTTSVPKWGWKMTVTQCCINVTVTSHSLNVHLGEVKLQFFC